MKFTKKANIFCFVAQGALIIAYFFMCFHAMAIPSDVTMAMFFAAFSIEQVCTTFIKTTELKYGSSEIEFDEDPQSADRQMEI